MPHIDNCSYAKERHSWIVQMAYQLWQCLSSDCVSQVEFLYNDISCPFRIGNIYLLEAGSAQSM